MNGSEIRVAFFALLVVLMVGLSIVGCSYQYNVVLPLRMAEKNLCYGPTNATNTLVMGWRTCAVAPKPGESPKPLDK